MRHLWRVGVVLLCFTTCFVPDVLAQSQATTGAIEGTVVDESGGVLPGSAVSQEHRDELRDDGDDRHRTAVSGDSYSRSAPIGSRRPCRASRRSSARASTSPSASR